MSDQLPLEALSKTKRLNILTPKEIDDLYLIPLLTEDERVGLFELTSGDRVILTSKISIAAKVDAIIRLGYFKQKPMFFQFKLSEVPDDVNHIMERYFDSITLEKSSLGREAKLRNQQWVLSITGYTLYSQTHHAPLLLTKAEALCRLSVNPVFILRELLMEVAKNKITRPGYSTFQKIISSALMLEQKRINLIFKKHLSEQEKTQLFNLIDREEHFYAITLLKNQPKNFKPTAVRQEIEYYEQYQLLYQIAKRLLPILEISKNGVTYYASLVEHYTPQSLNRINSNQTCLWLLCFIYHRCQRMLDNLATMFIYTANQYEVEVKNQAEALLLIYTLSPDEQKKTLAQLIRVYTDKTVNENQSFKNVKDFVYSTILPPERIDQVADELDNQKEQKMIQTEFTWQAVDEFADTYRPLLRALLKILELDGPQHKSVQKAYDFLQDALKQGQSLQKIPFDNFPIQFINSKISHFIYNKDEKTINTDRYEYECYQQIASYLNGRSLYLSDSINYQSLTDELLPKWEDHKITILKKINKPLLNQSLTEFIEKNAKPLDEKIIAVNEAIVNGENSYVKLKQTKEGTIWTLPYTKKILELNNPFYKKLPQVSIIRILQFVNEKTRFMQEFTHIKPYYSKSKLDEIAIYACLIANGTNLGIFKMANLCDLNYTSLQTTEKNYLRLATIRAANDVVSNAIAKLPIFRHWDLCPNLLHASLDGQKFVTEWDNIVARYSQKYFGFDKGVVAYSLIANHVPINTMIIGANEHESRFFFDLIYNNTSEIQPDIFSTDTEGSNQLNFLLLHLIERLYAPRYRSLGNKSDSIICFSDPSRFKNYLIKPDKKLNEKLILSEEDNIQHILASLLMGETKQSNIITKLSSQQYASRTKRALWEMNAVLMTDHILNYIGDVSFRQAIQGSLGRGEAYHQLRRHIERVNGRHFRGTNETQIAVWNESARLLANCVLYYNATMLNQWMEQCDARGEKEKSHYIKHLSPVAWTHVNFQGRYEFLSSHEEIDIDGWLDKILVSESDFKNKK